MKKIGIIIFSLCFVLLFSKTVFAATINEVEPNDSTSTAQLIQKNNEDPSKVVTGNYDGQNVVIGSITSSIDEDWYKVYLPANSNTILGINSTSLSATGFFDIYDESLNLVKSISYQKNSAYFGATPYYVNITVAGYYYVKAYSPLTTGEYRFFIGGSDYTVNTYTYNASSALTLTPTTSSVQAVYDLRNVTSIPNNAVVYYVSLQGTKTNSATNQSRSIKVYSDSSWITTSSYSYVANVPVISNKLLKNQWAFKLDGTVSTSTAYFKLTPQITFSYVYAVLP
ncbi:hypothetical protein JHL18_14990 [Clostridium sp. YIM B02505]|uniref:Peptidase C-terminal archaeal/bacterial domain-containing protein n=1 Tax=Clostridium yunnanense TaxID=2800325 RepID=A0ABS1ERG6_9CLOT|nr:hypothetical protein [Clostridium yunnanense]MBK1811925.1 hypothetical protein [Clostridium yunnanense]